MEKVLDVYFQFATGEDFYLDQLLTPKDLNSAEFHTPCPHWHDPNNPVVAVALELTFDQILMEHGSTMHGLQGVLSFFHASMVQNSD